MSEYIIGKGMQVSYHMGLLRCGEAARRAMVGVRPESLRE